MIATVGERIKNIRETLGLSQEDFGQQIGISRSGICTYEKNRRQPRERIYELISEKYSINIDYLKYGKGTMFNVNNMSIENILSVLERIYNLSPEDKSIITAFLNLKKEERAVFIKYIKSLSFNDKEPAI